MGFKHRPWEWFIEEYWVTCISCTQITISNNLKYKCLAQLYCTVHIIWCTMTIRQIVLYIRFSYRKIYYCDTQCEAHSRRDDIIIIQTSCVGNVSLIFLKIVCFNLSMRWRTILKRRLVESLTLYCICILKVMLLNAQHHIILNMLQTGERTGGRGEGRNNGPLPLQKTDFPPYNRTIKKSNVT